MNDKRTGALVNCDVGDASQSVRRNGDKTHIVVQVIRG